MFIINELILAEKYKCWYLDWNCISINNEMDIIERENTWVTSN
jgi:hypothetical protein